MKIKRLIAASVYAFALATVYLTNAAGAKDEKPKPDKLETCPVSGDKLGEMGKPYVFVYEGQEVKLCCKNCKKDFDKEPAKYIKKIQAADKDAKN